MTITTDTLIWTRQGRVAGAAIVIVVEAAFILIVITSSTVVSPLLPESAFLMALCNGVSTYAAISFLAHTPDSRIMTLFSIITLWQGPSSCK